MSLVALFILLGTGALVFLALRAFNRQRADATRQHWANIDPPASQATRLVVQPSRKRSRESPESADAFRFSPELFEYRTQVIEKLEAHGFSWFSHYSSVDCLHDVHGLEVCGIHEREDALKIRELLITMFPDWRPG